MALQETHLIADHLEGIKEPFENSFFCGQEKAEQKFLAAVNSGRLHHAWLLTGPKGVGKASFAFRIARALVEQDEDVFTLTSDSLNAASDESLPVFGKIAQRAHPNLLHLTIPYDDKTKKFKTELTVSEIRKTNSFFGTTAGEKGWRIALIDSADDMNINAANALLKILEEPPEKTLFFLLSEQPAKLLPTIHSRCQQLDFSKLSSEDVMQALSHAQIENGFDGVKDELSHYNDLINGSIRRAYQFLQNDVLTLYESFNSLVTNNVDHNVDTLYAFMDVICARGADDKFDFFVDFLESHFSNLIRQERPLEELVSLAEVWDKMQERLHDMQHLNLDKKQTVFAIFNDLQNK